MSLGEKRVIIVGAGASAMGAARTLIAAGVKPIILEARDRMGGRLFAHELTQNLSHDENKSDAKVTVQLGANWIHGLDANINPMFKVAQKLGLRLHQTSPDDEPGDDVLLFDSTNEAEFAPAYS
jgi:monoamine oxidase